MQTRESEIPILEKISSSNSQSKIVSTMQSELKETKSTFKSTAKKVALILLDVDDSIYIHPIKIPEDQSFEEWLINENKSFLEEQVKKLSSGGYDKVIIGNFSSRQSFVMDKECRSSRGAGSPSSTPIFPIFQSYLQSKLSCEVVFDPFWSADIFANEKNGGIKQTGDSYNLILKDYLKDKENLEDKENSSHSKTIYDHNKLTILYAHSHRVAFFHPEADCDIIIVDDSKHILEKLYANTLIVADKIFPKSTIHFLLYNAENSGEIFKSPIKTTGKALPNYDWGTRYLWSCYTEGPANTVEDLKKWHQEDAYQNPLNNNINANFLSTSTKAFAFKLQDFSFDGCESTLGDNPNYMTAEMLYSKKMIPLSYLVGRTQLNEEKINTYVVQPSKDELTSFSKSRPLSFIQSGIEKQPKETTTSFSKSPSFPFIQSGMGKEEQLPDPGMEKVEIDSLEPRKASMLS